MRSSVVQSKRAAQVNVEITRTLPACVGFQPRRPASYRDSELVLQH